MLLNLKAQCNVKEESNEEIIEINEGNILINGKNKINNETITGTYLVQFKESIKINNITFHNQNEEIKKCILSH